MQPTERNTGESGGLVSGKSVTTVTVCGDRRNFYGLAVGLWGVGGTNWFHLSGGRWDQLVPLLEC